MTERSREQRHIEQSRQSAQQAIWLAEHTRELLEKALAGGHPGEIAYAQQRVCDALGQVMQTQVYTTGWIGYGQTRELHEASSMLQSLYQQIEENPDNLIG